MKKQKIIWLTMMMLVLSPAIYCFNPEKPIPKKAAIDKLIVIKSKRQLQACSNGQVIKTYKVSLGRNPVGPKKFNNDNKTPEGIYFINDKNPNSLYHKNLGVSYPNKADVARASKMGKPPGGDIKIHGLSKKTRYFGKFHYLLDWTRGCIAVTDGEIDELYEAVNIGTPIEIRP